MLIWILSSVFRREQGLEALYNAFERCVSVLSASSKVGNLYIMINKVTYSIFSRKVLRIEVPISWYLT